MGTKLVPNTFISKTIAKNSLKVIGYFYSDKHYSCITTPALMPILLKGIDWVFRVVGLPGSGDESIVPVFTNSYSLSFVLNCPKYSTPFLEYEVLLPFATYGE
jgi:hypothetical protein